MLFLPIEFSLLLNLRLGPNYGCSTRVFTLQHPRLALIALSLGMFMVLLDSTILNIALPTIEHELHGSLESLQWIANSYTLIYASLLLTG